MTRVDESAAHQPGVAPGLEDLIPIAVVIGLGCQRCAESLVRQARRRGIPEALITPTLGIVARVSSAECLVSAVGPEAVGRMRKALRAGQAGLREAHGRVTDGACCESKR
jgi:hypothetical protein